MLRLHAGRNLEGGHEVGRVARGRERALARQHLVARAHEDGVRVRLRSVLDRAQPDGSRAFLHVEARALQEEPPHDHAVLWLLLDFRVVDRLIAEVELDRVNADLELACVVLRSPCIATASEPRNPNSESKTRQVCAHLERAGEEGLREEEA
eukprot:1432497-Rhodomonas_salina.2